MFFKNLVWQTLKPRTEIIAKSKIPNNITSVEDFVQQGALILFENVLEKYEVEKRFHLLILLQVFCRANCTNILALIPRHCL